jgi:hypothetical protein
MSSDVITGTELFSTFHLWLSSCVKQHSLETTLLHSVMRDLPPRGELIHASSFVTAVPDFMKS